MVRWWLWITRNRLASECNHSSSLRACISGLSRDSNKHLHAFIIVKTNYTHFFDFLCLRCSFFAGDSTQICVVLINFFIVIFAWKIFRSPLKSVVSAVGEISRANKRRDDDEKKWAGKKTRWNVPRSPRATHRRAGPDEKKKKDCWKPAMERKFNGAEKAFLQHRKKNCYHFSFFSLLLPSWALEFSIFETFHHRKESCSPPAPLQPASCCFVEKETFIKDQTTLPINQIWEIWAGDFAPTFRESLNRGYIDSKPCKHDKKFKSE